MTQVKALVDALDAFVVGCKADGTWNAIKASCIMAAWSNLNGALVPLVGTAPTRFGTEGGWNYNRKTGLQGNRTDNYLNSNRNNNADPQNNNHSALYLTAAPSITSTLLSSTGNVGNNPGTIFLNYNLSLQGILARNKSSTGTNAAGLGLGLKGTARSLSSSYNVRNDGTTSIVSVASDGDGSGLTPVLLFVRQYGVGGTFDQWSDARLAFYSIGESLNLALLDARVTTLINAISAAIP